MRPNIILPESERLRKIQDRLDQNRIKLSQWIGRLGERGKLNIVQNNALTFFLICDGHSMSEPEFYPDLAE